MPDPSLVVGEHVRVCTIGFDGDQYTSRSGLPDRRDGRMRPMRPQVKQPLLHRSPIELARATLAQNEDGNRADLHFGLSVARITKLVNARRRTRE